MAIIFPILYESTRQYRHPRYHFSPQERSEAGWERAQSEPDSGFDFQLPISGGSQSSSELSVCRTAEGCVEASSTHDSEPYFVVHELIYPGENTGSISDKWIYVLYTPMLQVRAEIHAIDPSNWLIWSNPNPQVSTQPNYTTEGYFEMTSGGESPADFAFFLSPIRLSQQGIDHLLESRERVLGLCVRPHHVGGSLWGVLVPDPFAWAADVNQYYYMEALNDWQDFVMDSERQAKLFIAGTLKGWINSHSDQFDIRNELNPGQPNQFINEYRSREQTLRIRAEEAMAYLHGSIMSSEHYVVELSAMENGGDDLTVLFEQWEVVSSRLVETAQGRKFAGEIYQDASRMPRRYLFGGTSPENGEAIFATTRYEWYAAVAILEHILPAIIGMRIIAGETEERVATVQRILERLRISVERQMRPYEAAMLNTTIHQADHITRQVRPGSLSWARRQGLIPTPALAVRSLLDLINFAFAAVHLASQSDDSSQRFWAQMNSFSAGVNLTESISEYVLATMSTRHSIATGQTGAALERAMMARQSYSAVRYLGGSAAIIGGVLQAVDEGRQAFDGYADRDYGIAAGHLIAEAGAAMTVVGSAISLANALGWASIAAGPVGLFIAIGTALIFGGNIIAQWFSLNDYERFARLSFLGNCHTEQGLSSPAWATVALPTENILEEAGALVNMSANFTLRYYREVSNRYLEIQMGYLTDRAVIEVEIDQQYGGRQPRRYQGRLQFSATSNRIPVVEGDAPFPEGWNRITMGQSGHIRSIHLMLSFIAYTTRFSREDYAEGDNPEYCRVKVRVRLTDRCERIEDVSSIQFVPYDGRWIVIDHVRNSSRFDYTVNSMEIFSWAS